MTLKKQTKCIKINFGFARMVNSLLLINRKLKFSNNPDSLDPSKLEIFFVPIGSVNGVLLLTR